MSQDIDQRVEPRVPIVSLHNLNFKIDIEGDKQDVAVANVSTKGIGLISAKKIKIEANNVYPGEITIGHSQHQIKFKVIYNNGITIGCMITESAPNFAEAVTNYFESELQALSLQPNDGIYEAEEGLEVSYYEGPNNCYVLLVKKADTVHRFKLSYFGNVFDGGAERELSMGQIVSDLDLDSFSHGNSMEVLKPLSEVAPEIKTSVIKYIDAMKFLKAAEKTAIKDQLQKSA